MEVLTKHNVLIQILASMIILIFNSVSFAENVSTLEMDTDTAAVVRITQGGLKGLTNVSRDGQKYSSFLGIQFGKSKRFQESEFADGWNGTFNATTFGSPCLQFDESQNSIIGSEDCLFLNVYTPQLTEDDNITITGFPVMVYFHGGGFLFGSGADYGAKYFMDEDVVLVTVNYRLGPFGFVDSDIGTNVGMKDQTLSLEWVKLNIHHFGGDAKVVTIFGESAGGKSVGLHILSPMSKGLFHRAISQSGVSLSKNILLEDPIREFRKLGVLMDCPTSHRKYLTECLAKVDGTYMLDRIERVSTLAGFSIDDVPNFGVTVETKSTRNGSRVFLPDNPINLLVKGEFAHIPYILGGNSDEALYIFINLVTTQTERNRVNAKWSEYAPQAFMYEKDNCKATNEIQEFYLPGHQIGSIDTIKNLTDAMTDRLILHPTKINAEFHSKFVNYTYLYYFSLRGPWTMDTRWSSLNLSNDGLAPAGHTDELQYLFTTKSLDKEILPGSPFEKFSDWFVNLWVTFAKNGITPKDWNPLHLYSTDRSEIETPPGTKTRENDTEWYQIDTHSHMKTETELLGERMNFWNSVFPFKST